MTKRPRSCARPFGLITAGLFLFTACYVVDADEDDDTHHRCRFAGHSMSLVAAVDGNGGRGGSSGSKSSGRNAGGDAAGAPAPAARPGAAVDTSKRDQATARPPAGDRVRKDPPPALRTAPPRRAHDAATPTPVWTTASPSPSRTGGCKGVR